MTGIRGNPDNLRQAAARKSAAAQTRAEQGLREMIRRNESITFRGLAQTADVSLDFLYRCAPIRHRIEHLRAQQQTTAAQGEIFELRRSLGHRSATPPDRHTDTDPRRDH